MTADDLSAPLGQQQAKRRRRFPIAVPHVIAAALAAFFGVFVIWAIVGDDPFGGESMCRRTDRPERGDRREEVRRDGRTGNRRRGAGARPL